MISNGLLNQNIVTNTLNGEEVSLKKTIICQIKITKTFVSLDTSSISSNMNNNNNNHNNINLSNKYNKFLWPNRI